MTIPDAVLSPRCPLLGKPFQPRRVTSGPVAERVGNASPGFRTPAADPTEVPTSTRW